jgi:hypothetical protein
MATRKRIKLSEKQLSLMWPRLLGKELTTEEGKRIKVLYPGRSNGDSGPDFRDAIISMDNSKLVKGDVEIHVNSRDWYSHGHHLDPEYNRVILHVVARHDGKSSTVAQNGNTVAVLCLRREIVPSELLPYLQLPCSRITEHIEEQKLKRALSLAGGKRFKQKAAIFRIGLDKEEAGQVLFQGAMRALGYAKNMKPFEELAQRVPLSLIEKVKPKESLLLKQAWLVGTAGLLPSQRWNGGLTVESEVRELEGIWHLVSKEAKTMNERDWVLSHIYPNNFPVRRIIAQSYLIQRYYERGFLTTIVQLMKEISSADEYCRLEDALIVPGDGYWREHFNFGTVAKTRNSALLGHGKAAEIVVNIILPFIFSWSELANKPILREKAIELYFHYPKLAENAITRHMIRQFCLEDTLAFTACYQQGLIHIYRTYCREGRCRECPLSSQG